MIWDEASQAAQPCKTVPTRQGVDGREAVVTLVAVWLNLLKKERGKRL